MLDESQKLLAVPPASGNGKDAISCFPEFSDLILHEQNPGSGLFFCDAEPYALEECMLPMANELVQAGIKKGTVDFATMSHGIPFRGHKMPTINGVFYVFRRMPEKIWTLDECGIRGRIADYILDQRHVKGGLIIVSGRPGAGKSTTCAAIIVDRLKKFGGMCVTVEDPVEMPLQGFHGAGLCFQRNLLGEQEFHAAVRETMRAYPSQTNSTMLIGEVRDAETAALALRSSVDGRLVLLTIHAGTIIQAIQRIISYASRVMGESEARALLASSIRLVMHQKKMDNRIRVTTLFDTQPVAGIIMTKEASLDNLKNEIQNQMNKLRLGMEIKPRNLED
ncbi:ATPase, T2SS/T4P/T4SS family [Pseudomonas luteola]